MAEGAGASARRLLAAAVFLVALAGAGAAVQAATLVRMTDELRFSPQSVTIKAGETVEWQNASVLVHTVTADPRRAANAKDVALPEGAKAFGSGSLEPGQTFRHTFRVPGTYRYFCIPHEAAGMVGRVVVTR